MTCKEYCDKVEKAIMDGVRNRTMLDAVIPLIVDTADRAKSMLSSAKKAQRLVTELGDLATDYAIQHLSVFRDGLKTAANGVRSGIVAVGDRLYHLANGYDGFKRISGGLLTQEFLLGLPKKWIKTKAEIDKTAIKREGVDCEELEKNDLYQPEKNVWTLGDEDFEC